MTTAIENTPENQEFIEKARTFFQLVERVECEGDTLRQHELVSAAMSWMAAAVRATYAGTHPAAITMMNGTVWFEAKHDNRNH